MIKEDRGVAADARPELQSPAAGSWTTDLGRSAELESALRRAVDSNRLGIVFQPLVRTGDGRMLGVEALLRWDGGPNGSVAPSTLIPIAERAGLMERIGIRVLETACGHLARWESIGLAKGLLVHVNLSLPELVDPRLAGTVATVVDDAGLRREQLCLEVTEEIIRKGGADAERGIHALEEAGIPLVLDDFGTGSSIEALTRYQFAFAKIDRALIGGAIGDDGAGQGITKERARLVRGLLGMAKSLGTTLIAEGVEHESEVDRIAALGIAKVQGYATGRPVSALEIERILLSEQAWGQSPD